MKRNLVLIAFVFAFSGIFAQQGGMKSNVNFVALQKKIAKSNADIENPKKNIKDATWISRAELMIEVYNSQILNAYRGMTTTNFNVIIGKPNEQTNIDIDGVSTDKYTMERVNFFFVEGSLEFWQVTNPVLEAPLNDARTAITKAMELDVNGKKTKKISENLQTLKKLYLDEGLNSYSAKKYYEAYLFFKNSIEIALMPQVNVLDTAIYYYAGLAAQLGEKNHEAIEMYKKAIEMGSTSEGAAFFNIYEAYKSVGNEDEGIKYLELGLVKYPQNLNILYSLINIYLSKGEDPSKIIIYIDKAIADNPTNASLFFAKGTLYDKLEQTNNALDSYLKAIELNNEYFDANYNIGAVYYNNGVKLVDEANKIPAQKVAEYDAMIEKSNAEFKKAIPFMTRAAELNPQSAEAVEASMNLYFRFRNESKENMDMYNKFKEMLDSLKQ